jgi:diketogulonate reductase-like aldo/keto reductase
VIPQLGFGWDLPSAADTERAIGLALECGYRLFDTAAFYGNEAAVGRALASSGIPRAQLFVTTKVWNADQGRERTHRAFDASLARLGMDYVDLYLILWPVPGRDLYVETWRALEELTADGRARTIGVANFQIAHLEHLRRESATVPAVNQVELHPWLQQPELRRYHRDHGVVTEAWSPLANGRCLQDPVIESLARAHGRTPAQIVLRWHLQLGNVPIPKSGRPERIRSNLDVFDFALSPAEMDRIAGAERGIRTGPHPDAFDAVNLT